MTTLQAIEGALVNGKAIVVSASINIKEVQNYLYRRGIIPFIDIVYKQENIHLSEINKFTKYTGGLISLRPNKYYIRLKYRF